VSASIIKSTAHNINPAKLLTSKWTAVQPINKEKHFLVTRVIRDDKNVITSCIVEAVLTRKDYEMDWRALKNKARWQAGWL
jgi:tryptophan-rich hypothetical protein